MRHRTVPVLLALVLVVPAHAQVLRPLTDVPRAEVTPGALDDAGSAIWSVTAADPLGTNPSHAPQVFRWDPLTSAVTQVTSFPEGVIVPGGSPVLIPSLDLPGVSVSDDGEWLAFVSRGNLTGANQDRGEELFLMRADGSVLRQLTSTSDPGARYYRFALSGGGNRVAFTSDASLLGGPAGVVQPYVVDAEGSGLRRLATSRYGIPWVSISDDGERVVLCAENDLAGGAFQDAFEIFAYTVPTGQMRKVTSLGALCRAVEISGDGRMLAFETSAIGMSPGPVECQGQIQIAAVPWTGGSVRNVSRACACQGSYAPGLATGPPTLTDDGAWVVYADHECGVEIYKGRTDTDAEVRLTQACADGTEVGTPVAAGGGSRGTFLAGNDPVFGVPNPDRGAELATVRLDGAFGERTLSSVRGGSSEAPDLTSDGSRLVFASRAQPEGGPSSHVPRLYRLQTTGAAPVPLTPFGVVEPRITDDGATAVFGSSDDPLGEGITAAVYAIGTDGANLRRLTPDQTLHRGGLDVAGSGAVVVYQAYETPADRIYRVNLDGSGRTLLASDADWEAFPRVDTAGTWVVYIGVNGWEPVRRLRTDLSFPPQSLFETGSNGAWTGEGAAISADGSVVAAITVSEFGGTNPERNPEVAVWEASTGTSRLLTSTIAGGHRDLALSGDGAWVYVVSDVPRFDPHGGPEIVRISVATGAVERVGGIRPCAASGLAAGLDGEVVAFVGGADCTGRNLDGNGEIQVIDRRVRPVLSVGREDPTLLSWDVESGPATYGVVRGVLASLALRQDGTVDLGTVSCVAGEAPVNRAEDPAGNPAPGQGFFYLTRGRAGRSVPPGSYGTGSGGGERTPSSGGCP